MVGILYRATAHAGLANVETLVMLGYVTCLGERDSPL